MRANHRHGAIRKRSEQGAAIVLASLIAIFSIALVFAAWRQVSAAGATSGQMIERRISFYAADAIARVTIEHLKQYLRSYPEVPSDIDITNDIRTLYGEPVFPGFVNDRWDIHTLPETKTGTLQSGPFEGMMAIQMPARVSVVARNLQSGSVGAVTMEASVADIGLFNFFYFVDGYSDVWDTGPVTVEGRFHTNGDFCAATSAWDLNIQRLTVARSVYAGANTANSTCRYHQESGPFHVRMGRNGAWTPVCADNDSTCTNCRDADAACAGSLTGMSWESFAPDHWAGYLMDSAHEVPELRLPILGYHDVQSGIDEGDSSGNNAIESNDMTARVAVDPWFPYGSYEGQARSADPSNIRKQKLAYQAGIRVIDGVWFLNNGSWPGTPIWSDHPGSFNMNATNTHDLVQVSGGIAVGQSDLAGLWGANIPNKFSFYEYDTTNQRLYEDNSGIISYGMLGKYSSTANHEEWHPAFIQRTGTFVSGTETHVYNGYLFDEDNLNTTYATTTVRHWKATFCSVCSGASCNDPAVDPNGSVVLAYSTAVNCGFWYDRNGDNLAISTAGNVELSTASTGAASVGRGAKYLEATRFGFQDYRVRMSENFKSDGGQVAKSTQNAKANVLPVNFMVNYFASALKDTTVGELGSYLTPSTFNGIVWLTSTWEGQLKGIGRLEQPQLRPRCSDTNTSLNGQDCGQLTGEATINQPKGSAEANNTLYEQRALPFMLCSDDLQGGPYSGPAEDSIVAGLVTDEPYFQVPWCREPHAATTQPASRPNALRIVHADTIDPTAFPKGLTIATNLPVYVLGNTNIGYQESLGYVNEEPADPTHDCSLGAAGCDNSKWMPFAIMGDAVSLQSRAWEDFDNSWAAPLGCSAANRQAVATEHWMAILAGDVPSSETQGGHMFINFLRYMENWDNDVHRIRGSLISGFHSVFAADDFSGNTDGSVRYQSDGMYVKPGDRNFHYDTHFDVIENQPPGTPRVSVSAIRSWQRDW